MSENFIMETFAGLITADLYIVVAAVFGVCYGLKKAAFFDDRFIPLAALVLGAVFEVAIALVSGGDVVVSILKGIIAGMASVYVANIIKQMKKGSDSE